MQDLISRQAAIDAMNAKLEDIKLRWRGKVKKGEIAMYLDMRGTIETLPSAEPVRHGKWIETDVQSYTWKVRCSVCGHERSMMSTQGEYPKYCEECGARMDEE